MTELEKWTPSLLTIAPWVGVPGLPQDTAVRDTRTVRDMPGEGPVTEVINTGGPGPRRRRWHTDLTAHGTRYVCVHDPRRYVTRRVHA